MRWPAATTLGVACYLFFLLYNLPAQQVIGWVAGGDQAQTVILQGVSGSVWAGGAERVNFQREPLGQLKWSFKPSRLLLGKLAYEIELKDTDHSLRGILLAGLGGTVRLEDIDALLPASQVPEWIKQRQIRIDGKIHMQQLDLALSNGQLTAAEGTVQWLEGSLRSPMNLMIGNLQADLSTDDDSGEIKAQIRDLKGAIGIEAELRLKPDGNYQFEGKLKPGDKADPGLTGALQAIGRKQPDGSIQLKYAGRI